MEDDEANIVIRANLWSLLRKMMTSEVGRRAVSQAVLCRLYVQYVCAGTQRK